MAKNNEKANSEVKNPLDAQLQKWIGHYIGVILQTSKNFSFVGIFLSILSINVSIIFWKLDQRTSFLIKQSEAVFKRLERNSPIDIGIFCN
ncbi:hypothetical protein [Acinetobacter baumannii]|nr:hypothetical protein [Acinetobacter baumannii]